MDGRYYNLWSTDNDKTVPNDDVVIKSVYDPSPVGYSLPASNAFTGFTTTGGHTNNPAEYNVKGNFDKGWYFYTKPGKAGNTFFFPASGLRYNNSGKLTNISVGGYYKLSSPSSNKHGRFLDFYSSLIYTFSISERSWGHSLRSAEEKKWRCVVGSYNVLTSAALHPPHARRGCLPFMLSWLTQSHIATSYSTQED